ncbi:LacI family DNA-binding transcriptional regulator [uncultured Dysosmobacter sp.]|uniref:LacI family DNA-binding transcriptional regulator n=1 Tax=uncultured Dysosmobacter sp. TaxID=2591384 RepID=UPI0026303B5D|nr:LacI family DNA-binding transcriptional regulator [uncultured Dysosmobacter sp.]
MTIKDIAEKSGVSVSTVSRVLNDHPDVSEANRARVMAVVRELHYVPNSSARDLVRPQPDAIGLVVRGVGNPFYTAVIRAIEQAVRAAGYTLVLHQIHTEDNEVPAAASLARAKKLRGLILLGGCFDYTPERIAALDVPFVCCSFTNSFGTLERTAYSSVSIDDQAEARRAVAHLIERGHRRIAILLDSTCDHSISQLRYRGYCQALEEAGIPLDRELVEETSDFDMAAAYSGTARLLKRRPDLTGLFAISDSMAVAAMKALHDGGKRVPEDCSVIAIDGIDISAYMIPTLTTLIQPQEELGEKAVRLLLDLIEGTGENRQLRLQAALREGGSVRAV